MVTLRDDRRLTAVDEGRGDVQPASTGRSTRTLLAVIAFVLVVWALRASAIITMPVAFALFLTIVCLPVQRRFEKVLPHWLSVVGVLLMLVGILAALGGVAFFAIRQVSERGPEYADRFRQHADAVQQWMQRRGLSSGESLVPSEMMFENAMGWVTTGLTTLWGVGAFLGFTLFLVGLMLLEMRRWRQKTQETFSSEASRTTMQTCHEIVGTLQRYLTSHTAISAASGILQGLWCLVLGVDFALLWALTAFLLNYLPNIGSLISFIPPTLMAFIQYDAAWAGVTVACLAGTDMIMGNVVAPLVQGKSLRLSPVVILVSVVFWGWVWGVMGAVLSVPITASLVIICLHVEGLRPIGRMLSEPCAGKRDRGKSAAMTPACPAR